MTQKTKEAKTLGHRGGGRSSGCVEERKFEDGDYEGWTEAEKKHPKEKGRQGTSCSEGSARLLGWEGPEHVTEDFFVYQVKQETEALSCRQTPGNRSGFLKQRSGLMSHPFLENNYEHELPCLAKSTVLGDTNINTISKRYSRRPGRKRYTISWVRKPNMRKISFFPTLSLNSTPHQIPRWGGEHFVDSQVR